MTAPDRCPPTVMSGVPIDHLTMDSCLDEIDRLVMDGRANNRTHQVATVNVDFLVNAVRQPDVMNLLQDSSLNLADGMPLVWGSPLLGPSLPERVAGADLVGLLAERSARRGWRVHFFGGGDDVARRASDLLVQRFPGAAITTDQGPIIRDPDNVDDDVIADIVKHDPDILCVALGNPKQERFIAAHRHRLGCPVMIGIGGSLDMLVGDKRRAPKWVQSVGAEWIVRGAQEPGRLGRRYLGDARAFFPLLTRSARTARRYASSPAVDVRVGSCGAVEVNLGHEGSPVEAFTQAAASLQSWQSVTIDCGDADAVSPLGHSALIGVVRLAVSHGVPIEISPASEGLRRCFDELGTLEYLHRHAEPRSHEAPKIPSASTLGLGR